MDYVILTAVTFFIIGFVIAALLFGAAISKASPEPVAQVDLNAMLQGQLQQVQMQNMMRSAQLEQARQEAELLALRQQRDGIARLNHSDIQAALSYLASSQQGYTA